MLKLFPCSWNRILQTYRNHTTDQPRDSEVRSGLSDCDCNDSRNLDNFCACHAGIQVSGQLTMEDTSLLSICYTTLGGNYQISILLNELRGSTTLSQMVLRGVQDRGFGRLGILG